MGSCDNRVTDWDAVVAMNPGQYSGCGACVEVLDVERGNVARFTVADRCAGCGWGQLDLTPGALNRLGRNTGNWGDAEFPIRWRYC